MNINNLKEALKTLKDAQQQYVKNSNRNLQSIFADSCVKRFEYTLETSVKLMKKILKNQYSKDETDLTINNIFRLMQSYGFISSWISWRNYYQQRNFTAHEYNLEKSRELLKITPSFIDDCSFLITKLDQKFSQEQYFQIISEILKEYADCNLKFYAYGSRVKGTFQACSDLDVLIKGDIAQNTLQTIKDKIDASTLPFIVHFINYCNIDKDFYESIKNDLLEL